MSEDVIKGSKMAFEASEKCVGVYVINNKIIGMHLT